MKEILEGHKIKSCLVVEDGMFESHYVLVRDGTKMPNARSYMLTEDELFKLVRQFNWAVTPKNVRITNDKSLPSSISYIMHSPVHDDDQEWYAPSELKIMYTDAPSEYDYGYVKELGVTSHVFKNSLRMLTVPLENYEYQKNRYISGGWYASSPRGLAYSLQLGSVTTSR